MIFADIFGGGGELDLDGGIAIGSDGVVLDGAMGSLRRYGQEEEKCQREFWEHARDLVY